MSVCIIDHKRERSLRIIIKCLLSFDAVMRIIIPQKKFFVEKILYNIVENVKNDRLSHFLTA
jgi:hypothetical protein